jgi:hypothetical protein
MIQDKADSPNTSGQGATASNPAVPAVADGACLAGRTTDPSAGDAADHCLRPAFTLEIAKDLERGAAINLLASPGQGAGRLLEDLKALPGPGLKLIANLKPHRRNQAGLVSDLWHQTGLDGPSPADFGTLCLRLEEEAPGAALLLHRFDALFNEPHLDPAYNLEFIAALNALHNRGLSLLCVSTAALTSQVLLSSDGHLPGSLLNLGPKPELPSLLHAEIRSEIARRRLPFDESEAQLLADAVMQYSRPMELLHLCTKRLRDGMDGELPLPTRLKRWGRDLDRRRMRLGTRWVMRMRDLTTVHWLVSGLPPPSQVLKTIKDLLPWLGGKGR